ncbi:MAG: Fur family transcriptional regulator [Rhodocyclaceae bacterium]
MTLCTDNNPLRTMSIETATAMLRRARIPVTAQRVEMARAFLSRPAHMPADDILDLVRTHLPSISRATVYNTLRLFVEHGLIRELIIDADRVVYDSSTHPHHHVFNVDTGEVSDLPDGILQVMGTPVPPPGYEVASVELVVRVRKLPS